jgi:uncharacterized protein YdeI (YjbR/CyaY-like superfamily)
MTHVILERLVLMKNMNKKVDEFFSAAKKWQQELEALRTIVLDCGLTEELKWRQPCYTFQGGNILLISGFKEYCVISFFKGALLKDVDQVLEKPGKNTQSARLIRFTSLQEIVNIKTTLEAYIYEAIEVEKAGLKVDFKETSEFPVPEELYSKFDESPAFKTAFDALTPGRQRGYMLHFFQPKQATTRKSRIEKCEDRILNGFGLNDCICGLSKRMPNCDGSHKYAEGRRAWRDQR